MQVRAETVTRRLFALAWPSVVEQFQRTMVALADTFILSQLGATALTAVGLAGQAFLLGQVAFTVIGLGTTILVGRAVGAENREEAGALTTLALMGALVIGAGTAGISLVVVRPMLTVFGAGPAVIDAGTAWLKLVAPSFAFTGLLLVGAAAWRGAGDTRTPLAIVLLVNLAYLALAWALTHGAWGMPAIGVRGNAISAALTQAFGGCLVLALLWRGRAGLRLKRIRMPDWQQLGRMIRLGLPAGLEQILLQVVFSGIAVIMARMGTAIFAANQISSWVTALAYLPGWGIGIAVVTLVSHALGAHRPAEADEAVGVAWWMAIGLMAALGGLLFVLATPIMRIFTADPAVIAAGRTAIRIAAFIQPAMATAYVFSNALIGAGDTSATSAISILATWCLRLPIAYLAGVVLGWGLGGVWLGIGLDYAGRGVWYWLRFRRGRWKLLMN